MPWQSLIYLIFLLAPFTMLMAIVILVCSRKRQKLIPLLGMRTPILLFSIIALVYLGLIQGSSFQGAVPLPQEGFMQGLIGGYQTMDLIAAFIFATVIMPRFQTTSPVSFAKDDSSQHHRRYAIVFDLRGSLLDFFFSAYPPDPSVHRSSCSARLRRNC